MTVAELFAEAQLVLIVGMVALSAVSGAIGWLMRGLMDAHDDQARRAADDAQRMLARANQDVDDRKRVTIRVRAKSEPLRPSYDSRKAAGKGPAS